jgi:hypothetical protein
MMDRNQWAQVTAGGFELLGTQSLSHHMHTMVIVFRDWPTRNSRQEFVNTYAQAYAVHDRIPLTMYWQGFHRKVLYRVSTDADYTQVECLSDIRCTADGVGCDPGLRECPIWVPPPTSMIQWLPAKAP